MLIFYKHFVLFIILIILVNVGGDFSSNVEAEFIPENDVLKLAQCFVDADYEPAGFIPPDRIAEMNEILKPHETFANHIKSCIDTEKLLNTKELLNTVLKSSGIEKFLQEFTTDLKTSYNNEIKKYPKYDMQKWLKGELEIEEIRKNFELWKKDSEHLEEFKENDDKLKSSGYKEHDDDNQENSFSPRSRLGKKYVTRVEQSFNMWRRKTTPLGIYLKIVYLNFGKMLIDKLKQYFGSRKGKGRKAKGLKVNENKINNNLLAISQRMGIEIESGMSIIKYFFEVKEEEKTKINEKKEKKELSPFFKAFEKMRKIIEKIKIKINNGFDKKESFIKFPKVKRVIWVIRHSQRLDNDEKIKENAKNGDKCYYHKNRIFEFDNSPLSDVGMERAARLQKVFANIPINHLFASPYERTIETSLQLLKNNHKKTQFVKTKINKTRKEIIDQLKIKLEPGFIEKLAMSGNTATGYEECEELEKHHKRLDCQYKSILNRKDAEKYEKQENRRWDIACIPRIENVFTQLLKQNIPSKFNQDKLVEKLKNGQVKSEWLSPGEENAEHIVIVTHQMVVISLEQMLMGRYTAPPQVSITKIVEIDKDFDNDSAGNESKIKNLRMIYSGITIHLNKKGKDTIFYEN